VRDDKVRSIGITREIFVERISKLLTGFDPIGIAICAGPREAPDYDVFTKLLPQSLAQVGSIARPKCVSRE